MEGLATFAEEQPLVFDLSHCPEACSQPEMPPQNGQRTRTELDAPVIARFGLAPIDAGHSGFVDTDGPVDEIHIVEDQCNLLGWSESCEKPKLIVVALGFAPILVDAGNESLGVVNTERTNFGPVRFSEPSTAKVDRGIFMKWPIAVSEVECVSTRSPRCCAFSYSTAGYPRCR